MLAFEVLDQLSSTLLARRAVPEHADNPLGNRNVLMHQDSSLELRQGVD